MIFFTADMHFGHEAIIKHANRPFSSIDDMDNFLIEKWNEVVTNQDVVYHIGDFAWKNADEYFKKLNGNIVFILGNHDNAIKKGILTRKQIAKSHIHSITIIEDEFLSPEKDNINLSLVKDKKHIVMCHYPMRSWNRSHYGAYHLYGHVHGRWEVYGKSYDVGVDNNNYHPISYVELKIIMDSLPHSKNMISLEGRSYENNKTF